MALGRDAASTPETEVLLRQLAWQRVATLREARKLGIPTFAMVDTNSDPSLVDFPIPANDDATKSIELVVDAMIGAVLEGLEERKRDKDSGTATPDEEPEEEAVEAPGRKRDTKVTAKMPVEGEDGAEDETEAGEE